MLKKVNRQALNRKLYRQKLKSGAISKVRTLMKSYLFWVSGFPIGLTDQGKLDWVVAPNIGHRPTEQIQLDGQRLRQATYTVKRLCKDFPRALPEVVGNVNQWKEGIFRLLELLKPPVHQGTSLASHLYQIEGLYPPAIADKAAEIVKSHRILKPLIDASSWIYCPAPGDAKQTLNWIQKNAPHLEGIAKAFDKLEGVTLCFSLWYLAKAEGENRIDSLVRLLGDRQTHQTAFSGGVEFAERIASTVKKKRVTPEEISLEIPKGQLGAELKRWTYWLVQQDSKTRRRSLALFKLIRPEYALEAWTKFWAGADKGLTALNKQMPLRRRPENREQVRKLRGRFIRLRDRAPSTLNCKLLMESLRLEAAPEASGRFRMICQALQAVPNDSKMPVVRARFLVYWSFMVAEAEKHNLHRIQLMVTSFGSYLKKKKDKLAIALRPWKNIYSDYKYRWYGHCLDYDILEKLPINDDIPRFFVALDCLLEKLPKGIYNEEAETLAALVGVCHDPVLAVKLFLQLKGKKISSNYFRTKLLEMALALTRDDPGCFGDVVEFLQGCEYRDDKVFDSIVADADQVLRKLGLSSFLLQLLKEGHFRRLLECGYKQLLVRKIKADEQVEPPIFAAPVETGWIERLPEVLHGELLRLGSVHKQPERAANSILAKDFPDPVKLKKELAAINRRLQGAGQAEAGKEKLMCRKIALEKRLEQQQMPSPARLERLQAKIRRAIHDAVVDEWERYLDSKLIRSLSAYLGIESKPEWLFEPRVLKMLHAVMELEPGENKALASRLLRLRVLPPPWDLRDDEPNRNFIEEMERRGIAMNVWVKGAGVVEMEGPKGQKVRLQLEDDLLEIFFMGAHFKTCLSPGDFNFFSVFANAADINKRVLYARDTKGKVLGRCLLALTKEGGIVTFHPYTHDETLKFAEMVRDFVNDLAAKMNTIVVPEGHVQKLVADKWYDDGPEDLTKRFAFLEDGSKFRKRLAAIEPDNFVSEIQQAFAPLPLNEMTLPLVINLKELEKRPRLVVPLFPYIESCRSLREETLVKAALLLKEAGEIQKAKRLFGWQAEKYVWNVYRETEWIDVGALKLLLCVDPANVLRILRKTRPAAARNWQDEDDGDRLYLAALAHEALQRPKQAALLFRMAAREVCSLKDKRECLKRAKKLET
ncbi:MAG: hypothetical protein GTO45_22160 [Candidatus Aminicenantes bacterium]|nr:hypothetical protein [Candidatus Aminicenantes bacterium]NIN20838.1 hypothetical protein [Candidatus Aminicenantes bacterium]NIN44659.1 hypothetical protein [Candidatus Aminicenantes bacterium]NIN87468.1 hypothetical protein [Candidatus Aminicenantes bacterium]NIO83757.1 hypothetical protein [Candidatus Aminicenantes bacterium]